DAELRRMVSIAITQQIIRTKSRSSFLRRGFLISRSKLKYPRPSRITLADSARDVGDWESAAHYYERALQQNWHRPEIWIQYGHVLKESGDLIRAETAYKRALAYGPGNADSHLHLGHALKLQGKHEEAEAAYLRAFVHDPSLAHPEEELKA